MNRSPLFRLVVLSVGALACGPHLTTVGGNVALPDGTMRQVSHGVFEVVVPAPTDDSVTYAIPLPFDLLPFGLRDQKLWPIGTAFAVAPNQFVSAAHVLLGAQEKPLYLRSVTGATYEVTRVLKFSQYRDLVLLDVATPPSDVVPLTRRSEVPVGEPVLTIGNAVGQGIVARGGVVTSFTPEEQGGLWKNIRFTSPASPGNSGGPLVDAAGRVVGVVVRKSPAENLNVAVPIDELEKLSTTSGDLSNRGSMIQEDHQEMRVTWDFHTPLPASPTALVRAARKDLAESIDRWYAEFDTKFATQIFPGNPKLKRFLMQAVVPTGLGRFEVDGNGVWSIHHEEKFKEVELSRGQKAFFFDGPDKSSGQVILDRPKGSPLEAFFKSPKALADAVVRNYSWSIPFAGRPITIRSLGKPASHDLWVDEYGRPWFFFMWRLEQTDERVLFSCLTNPTGWACTYMRFPAPLEANAYAAVKRLARRTTLSYWGLVQDWADFLALPDQYKPRILNDATVHFDDGLAVHLGPMIADRIVAPSLTPASSLYADVSLDPYNIHEQRIYQTRIHPRVAGPYELGVYDVLAPTPASPALEADLWPKLQTGAAPFDNVPYAETNTTTSMKRGVHPPRGEGEVRMILEFCRKAATDPTLDLPALCTAFERVTRVGTPP